MHGQGLTTVPDTRTTTRGGAHTMTDHADSPTTREKVILLAIAHAEMHGTITTMDMRALTDHGIRILDLLDGLVPDPTALYLSGRLSTPWLTAALTRWAGTAPAPTRPTP